MPGHARPSVLRDLARARLDRLENVSPEQWAREVEEARKRGCRLVRVPGLTVEIRDYSLDGPE